MNEPDNASQAQEQNQRIEDNLNKIKNRIVVFSGKGGVGKTTVARNVITLLSQKGLLLRNVL